MQTVTPSTLFRRLLRRYGLAETCTKKPPSTHFDWPLHDRLLVEATEDQPDEFRRIGVGMIKAFDDDLDYFTMLKG